MIIHRDPTASRQEMQVRQRLEVLERHLRRASDGGMKLGDYAAWLEHAGLTVPSRQTLRLDVERYVERCDDLVYGNGHKTLRIDVHATRDAVRYFLGEPWLASPLQPKLPSSACRCLLLAMHFGEEVEFQYAALPQAEVAPAFKFHRGVPLRTLPGSDSGYMAIWQEQGRIMHINLARVRGRAFFTGRSTEHYLPPPPDPERILCVQSGDALALQRCTEQFAGGVRVGGELRVTLPASLAVMSADFLEAWWRRTATAQRVAERTLELPNGPVLITLQAKGEE